MKTVTHNKANRILKVNSCCESAILNGSEAQRNKRPSASKIKKKINKASSMLKLETYNTKTNIKYVYTSNSRTEKLRREKKIKVKCYLFIK